MNTEGDESQDMNLQYTLVIQPKPDGETHKFTEMNDAQSWCCDEFKRRFADSEYYTMGGSPPIAYKANAGSEPPTVGVLDTGVGYESHTLQNEFVEISHCPWCGAEITVGESERVVEVTEERTVEKTVQTTETETKRMAEEEWSDRE